MTNGNERVNDIFAYILDHYPVGGQNYGINGDNGPMNNYEMKYRNREFAMSNCKD